MQRTVQIALIGLILVIGLTVGSLAWQVASAPRVAPELQTTDPAIGYAFYQALDEVLASGDRAALDGIVSSGFVDHDGHRTASAGELVDELLSFRASFPETRFQVRDMQSASGTLVATLAPVWPAGMVVDGLILGPRPDADRLEILRVWQGKVTDRWASATPAVGSEAFPGAALAFDFSAGSSLRLEEIDLPMGSSARWHARGMQAVMVETGTISVELRRVTAKDRLWQSSDVVDNGQVISVTAGNGVTVHTEAGAPARVLVLTVQTRSDFDSSAISLDPGATETLLFASSLPTAPYRTWHLSFGRISLSPGAAGMLTGDGQSMALLANTSGSARLSLSNGRISMAGSASSEAPVTTAPIDAGNAVLAEHPTSMELTNTGEEPVVIWFVGARVDAPSTTPAPSNGTPTVEIPRGTDFRSE